jgi:hypothetical protein
LDIQSYSLIFNKRKWAIWVAKRLWKAARKSEIIADGAFQLQVYVV